MKKIRVIAIVLMGIFFSGCVSSSLNYTPPKISVEKKIITNKIVNKDYNKAWNELVNNLADNSFVINNLNKESGFINIDFSISNPTYYVDCGEWNGHFKNLRVDQQYKFNGAESTTLITKYSNSYAKIYSQKTLNGKINILLQKIEKNKQKMKVNVKYILQNHNEYNIWYPEKKEFSNWTIGFDSKNKGYAQNGQTQCQTRGVLEKKILSYIE